MPEPRSRPAPCEHRFTMKTMIRIGLVLGMFWGAHLAWSAEAGQQPTERELRSAVRLAEQRFFDLYNRVNVDRRHQMACENEDLTGSRLRKSRTCRTRGESQIGEDAAREYLQGLQLGAAINADGADGTAQDPAAAAMAASLAPAAATPTGTEYADKAFTDTRSKLEEERKVFETHLLKLMQEHPELRQRFEELMRARQAQQAASTATPR